MNPNSPTALTLRGRFPTSAALASASMSSLFEIRGKAYALSDAKLVELQLGRLRVFGRIAGRRIETMYALLKLDAEVLNKIPKGQDPPAPILYDPDLHRRHREGHYQPLKSSPRSTAITLLPPNSPE